MLDRSEENQNFTSTSPYRSN